MRTVAIVLTFLATTLSAGYSVNVRAEESTSGAELRSSDSAAELTGGEVRKVDRDNRKITIRHGELRNLDMPAMTMVFRVSDPALLDRVKAGDKVRFRAEKAGSAFIVTDLQLSQ